MITLGERSRKNLLAVHPDIVRVVKRAAVDAPPHLDFMVLEGVRTRTRMMEIYGQGRSVVQLQKHKIPAVYAKPNMKKVSWLSNPFNSKHAIQHDGYGHAVDLVPWPIDWNNLQRFNALARLILDSAKAEKVNLLWGCDWDNDGNPREKGETDSPHFQIVLP